MLISPGSTWRQVSSFSMVTFSMGSQTLSQSGEFHSQKLKNVFCISYHIICQPLKFIMYMFLFSNLV